MQKHTSGANTAPVNVVLITLDNHMSAAVDDARRMLADELPNLHLSVHAATDWNDNPDKLQACKDDIAKGNIIVASMLFIEEHVKAIGPSLAARRDHGDAMMCCMWTGEIMKNTSMGRFKMDGEQKGPLALLKKLRGDRSKDKKDTGRTAGERQMAMLKRLPKLLRFIPGTAQDVRNYFIAMQYRIAASDANIATIEERKLVNARAGVSQEVQGWSLDVWAKNLLDREYVSNAIVVNASDNVRQNYGPVLGQRRTTGVTFTYRFQ